MKRTPLTRTSRLKSRTRLKSRGKRGSRLLSADKRWAEEIKRRYNFTCQKCGRVFSPRDERLEAAHYYHRQAFPHLRWDTRNGVPLCKTPCHRTWAHGNPLLFRVLMAQLMGPYAFMDLVDRAYQGVE